MGVSSEQEQFKYFEKRVDEIERVPVSSLPNDRFSFFMVLVRDCVVLINLMW